MRYSKNDAINKKVMELLKDGWIIKCWNRHLRIIKQGSKLTITVPGSPSDHRAVQNWLHQVKNATALSFAKNS